jgi:phenylalanyl-tRNA synthetase alpha chain
MLDRINQLLSEVTVSELKTSAELESFRLRFLSKKGLISELFDDFRNVPVEEKKEIGLKLNLLKQKATEKYNLLKNKIPSAGKVRYINDLTRPAYFHNKE